MKIQIRSLAFKLFILGFAFVFSTVFIVFQISSQLIEREIRTSNDLFITQMQSKLDQYITLSFSSLSTILYAIESSYSNEAQMTDGTLLVLQKLYDMNTNSVANVYIINDDASMLGGSPKSILFNEPDHQRLTLLKEVMANKNSVYVSPPYHSKQQGWTVTMAKYLGTSNPPKVAALDIDLNGMAESLLNLNRSDSIGLAIVDPNGILVSGNMTDIAELDPQTRLFTFGKVTSSQLVSQGGVSGVLNADSSKQKWYYRKLPASRFNWTIMTFNNDSLLQQSLKRTETYQFVVLGIGVLLSALTAAFIARYIRKPLSILMGKMRLVKQGFLNISVVLKRNDEFGELSISFDSMLKQIIELLEQVKRSNELQRELEVHVLQAQINPHFLYNTLGAISNAVSLGYLDKVDPIIRSLIRILEYGVTNDSRFVPLSEELLNVREYLFIQNARNKVQYEWVEHVEPGLETFTVFRLLLQPIVENSFYHGYRGGRVGGKIHLHAYHLNGNVIIDVTDNGIGMTEEQVTSLLSPVHPSQSSEPPARKRIGIVNIHQRIQLYYGEEYGLTIESKLGSGTCVRATFPYITGGIGK